ncbi:MAG: HAD-IA family hydrolase [Pseudomonadota bacterium]
MTLKLAIWDMDGTIVDSRAVIQSAMVRAFAKCGLPEPSYEATRKVVGLDLDEACRRVAGDALDPGRLPELVDAYRTAFVLQREEEHFHEPLYEGAVDLLETLFQQGWLQAIATGKSRRGVDAVFEKHPLSKYFDTTWCADDGPGKPHPFMCQAAMNALGVEAESALMIGDSIFDVQMGNAAGVETHGVTWGFGNGDELASVGADHVHTEFSSLHRALENFFVR